MPTEPVLTRLTLILGLVVAGSARAQHRDVERPAAWGDLVFGGRFQDRFEPIPLLGPRRADTWGVPAVRPRDVLNGIEEPTWSYWGGNLLEGADGTFHLFVCRWPESHPKGHMGWPQSEVVRAVSRQRLGPYRVAEVLGSGHNPEAYRLSDGRVVCYVINAFYLGESLTGPWQRRQFTFEPRDRKIVANLSNCSFCRRPDGSFLMVNRGGGMWVSRDGLGPWEQVTQERVYPPTPGARFEDPVLWRTGVQYHLIVNDWFGRIATHLRSKEGIHWTPDPGEAYAPGIAVSTDGRRDDWYKYERIKVFQDDHGRAVQANVAVIDDSKWEDKPHDIHSSKNISIPLTPGRLLTLVSPQRRPGSAGEIRVRIAAEPGFDPQRDIDTDSLRFGAPEAVDFGRGSRLVRTESDGNDLIAVFGAAGHGFAAKHFTGKLLGRRADGSLLFGFCRLPWVRYDVPVLSARRPQAARQADERTLTVEIANHGTAASGPSTVRIAADGLPTLTAPCPALAPLEKRNVVLTLPPTWPAGSRSLRITSGPDGEPPLTYTTTVTLL